MPLGNQLLQVTKARHSTPSESSREADGDVGDEDVEYPYCKGKFSQHKKGTNESDALSVS
jgi:hypothetical protein